MGKFYLFHFRNTDAQKIPQDYIDNKLKNLDLYSSMDDLYSSKYSYRRVIQSPSEKH